MSVQLKDLAATIAAVPCDTVLLGTPHDLTHLLNITQPVVSVTYDVTDVTPSEGGVASWSEGMAVGSASELQQQLRAFLMEH
jgi:hypothetical protein